MQLRYFGRNIFEIYEKYNTIYLTKFRNKLKKIQVYIPVIFDITIVILEYEAVESSNRDSSLSAFTEFLRSIDSVRKSMAKNRNPSSALQLRVRRRVFRFLLFGGPIVCKLFESSLPIFDYISPFNIT